MLERDWRIEKQRSILCGSTSSERRWLRVLESLKGLIVTDLQLFGRLSELDIAFSNGLHLLSFVTSESQPEWAVICRNPLGKTLCVKRGKLTSVRLKVKQWHLFREDVLMDPAFLLRKGALELDFLENRDRQNL